MQDVKRWSVKRRRKELHFSLWVQLEVFDGPGVRVCARTKNAALLTTSTFLTTPSVAGSMSSHTSVTQQAVSSFGQLYENVRKAKEGGGGGEEGGKTPQKRICNSAPSSPNYSGALLKSATRQREKKKRQMVGERGSRKQE